MADAKRAKKYAKNKLILSISETVLMILMVICFIFSGSAVNLRDWVDGIATYHYLNFFLFMGILAAALSIFSLTFSFISGYVMEHRYQLSNQTLKDWILESLKGLAVGVIIAAPILFFLYLFLTNFPDTWWIWTGTVLFIFSVVLSRIAPQVILPIFYKFEALDNEELLTRMKKLAEQGHFNLEGVFRFDMSKDTSKANAALTGIGKSKRIILGDNLINNFSVDEIESVFAHEVGHHVHKHIWILMLTGTISSYLMFYLSHLFYVQAIAHLNYQTMSDLAGLPVLFLIFSLAGIVLSPFNNLLSRRYERQADRYAIEKSGSPRAFITSMQKLTKMNLTDSDPHPIIEFLFHGHPAVDKRIKAAEEMIEAQNKDE